MLRVKIKNKPKNFDNKVRLKGLSAIDELVGRPPRKPHPGPKRKRITARESDIPSESFPTYWTDIIPDMMKLYDSKCAYLSMHLEPISHPTVDHFIPKSKKWQLVYEWKNYRLSASVVNSKKGNRLGFLDPKDSNSSWFELNMNNFKINRSAAAPVAQFAKIDLVLELLNLRECCALREEYVVNYKKGPHNAGVDISYIDSRAPFIASELRRLGLLLRGDV